MITDQRFGVRLLGSVYLVTGLLGFLPFPDLNPLHADGIGARYLMNLVAVNAGHNALHVLLGLWALLSAQTSTRIRPWGIVTGGILIALGIAGMIQAVLHGFPVDQLLFGIIVLNLPGHVFHLVTGYTALSIGLSAPNAAPPAAS
jgi:predicted permease